MERGKLITIEGLDGAGKTTLASALVDTLHDHGRRAQLLREPGGVPAAEAVRALVKDPGLRISDRTEALLYAAARAQLVEEALEPLLARGIWVVLDRFVDSSLAYQGAGRGLGLEFVREINAFATAGLAPDLTLLLRVDPATGRERSQRRGEAPDRLELQSDGFFDRVAAGYDALASADPGRIRTLDASGSPEAVLAAAQSALGDLLG